MQCTLTEVHCPHQAGRSRAPVISVHPASHLSSEAVGMFHLLPQKSPTEVDSHGSSNVGVSCIPSALLTADRKSVV